MEALRAEAIRIIGNLPLIVIHFLFAITLANAAAQVARRAAALHDLKEERVRRLEASAFFLGAALGIVYFLFAASG